MGKYWSTAPQTAAILDVSHNPAFMNPKPIPGLLFGFYYLFTDSGLFQRFVKYQFYIWMEQKEKGLL